MTLKGVPAFTIIAIVWLGAQVEAQTPFPELVRLRYVDQVPIDVVGCPELVRLRNEATEAWKQAMRAPRSERCGALNQASSAAEATLKYADSNRNACNISLPLLNQVEGYRREAVQARDNVCAGRPLRPYPPDIIQH